MLNAGRHAGLAKSSGARRRELGDGFRVVSGASRANDSVKGLGINIADGRVVHVDAEVSEHLPGSDGDGVRRIEGARGTQRHGPRHLRGNRRRDPCDEAIFLVDADKERLPVTGFLGNGLKALRQGSELVRISHIALEKDNRADSVIPNQCPDVVVDLVAVEANGEQLQSLC